MPLLEPTGRSREARSPRAVDWPAGGDGALAAGRRVLVVDDEEDVRQFVRFILEDAGYVVDCAADGQQALRSIAAGRPDLVVLDLMMPEMDGWEVLDQLQHTTRPPRVIVLSAFADSARAIKAGATDCLSKPFRFGHLLEACRRALGRDQ